MEQATRKVQEIHRRFKIEVVIETFPSIPENRRAQYKPAEKNAFFRRWAETSAADEGVKGIYVLSVGIRDTCKSSPINRLARGVHA